MNPNIKYWTLLIAKMLFSAWLVTSVALGNVAANIIYNVMFREAFFSYTPPINFDGTAGKKVKSK